MIFFVMHAYDSILILFWYSVLIFGTQFLCFLNYYKIGPLKQNEFVMFIIIVAS
jgi:hypothetical protein